MAGVRRVYVEKKPEYAVAAKELAGEAKSYLGIRTVLGVRVLIRYDVEHVGDEVFSAAMQTVFSEPPVDFCYPEEFPLYTDAFPEDVPVFVFSVEYVPGQFDQRADSAEQCIRLLDASQQPVIRTATTYVVYGELTEADKDALRAHCINPVDSRETSLDKPETLTDKFDDAPDVIVLDGFRAMEEAPLRELYDSFGLAMTFADFCWIQTYFRDEEQRDPSMTEMRVPDTYWSDHCRHTTFSTELSDVTFGDGPFRAPIENTWKAYQEGFASLYAGRSDKYVCLMDIALSAMKLLKREGKLADQEESDEINACSIVVPVEVDGKTEEWLVNFKNETHNHPTEIEPFGGAATCLGGAIRDPLSGRTYVYQAMRVTGAADPTVSVKETIPGKLPQKKLVREAAHGYSSYGNQIGLATGYVKEIYHPNYVAKRMEIGAVMGAAPRRAVRRLNSDPGDRIILLGGRTGRDGIGGATGSSKAHNTQSTAVCGAEVQKGNPPTERKLQRLFRREEVSWLIKKCNDFGAGGVSVAIGELAPGLRVNLDLVPKKYAGLDGTELAISESQERMAVVVAPEDVAQFMAYAAEENLEATEVAVVTEEPRLVLEWRGKKIVDLSRAFLDTNGAHQETSVFVELPDPAENAVRAKRPESALSFDKAARTALSDLNVCSQKGLVERFDSSIGAGSVLMPYGGKYQLTETQSMIAKLPVLDGDCDTVTMMAYGFDPYVSSWSPYHGANYAVAESVARIVASGGEYKGIRFTFQEFYRRMSTVPARWSQPFAALLGAYHAQMALGLPSIGGKDSMSGTFNDIDVPPTLVSFAVAIGHENQVVTPELKTDGALLGHFAMAKDAYDLPDYPQMMRLYDAVLSAMRAGQITAAYAADAHGLAPAVFKMAFGNAFGADFDPAAVSMDKLFGFAIGDIVAEIPADKAQALQAALAEAGLSDAFAIIGRVRADGVFTYGDSTLSEAEAAECWQKPLEKVFATTTSPEVEPLERPLYQAPSVYVCKKKIARPTVFIPVFPGTNCEYDSAAVFKKAGADPVVRVFRNQNEADIRDSVDEFVRAIDGAQMIMFPGGFSAGDEPEGSAKFFATAFRNEKIKEAVQRLLSERDGLALGICNGFQALIKLGLVPYGEIRPQDADSPTLTYNTIGRHISKEAYIKVVSNKSPWLAKAQLGATYVNPASHGEGRFVAPAEWIEKLFANGQVATRYVDADGNCTSDDNGNINGSFAAIEGITSPDGRVYGKMCHSERIGRSVAVNISGEQDLHLFESGVEYFH